MTDDQHIHLHVSVDHDSEPIHGTIHNDVGTTIAFTGWLQLMAAFDTAREQPQSERRLRDAHAERCAATRHADTSLGQRPGGADDDGLRPDAAC